MSKRKQAAYDRIWKNVEEAQERLYPGKFNDGLLHTWDNSECVCPKCIGQVKHEQNNRRICMDCGHKFKE